MIRVAQIAVDWRDDFNIKEINKLAKKVGGQYLQEYSQDCVDAKIAYIASRPLDYDEMDQLWEACEMWPYENFYEARSFQALLKKLKAENDKFAKENP